MTPRSRTRVKICGIRSVEIAEVALAAGADAVGLVVEVPGSPRSLSLEEAQRLARALPKALMTIAVFKDPPAELVERWPGTWVQLHGDEDEALVRRAARGKHVVKGLRFDAEAVKRWSACPHVDVLLVDGPAGGSGRAFDHGALAALLPGIEKPVIVAGGLTAGNVGRAIRAVRPFAVDVSSGVESGPGEKDPDLIRRFCRSVAEADAS